MGLGLVVRLRRRALALGNGQRGAALVLVGLTAGLGLYLGVCLLMPGRGAEPLPSWLVQDTGLSTILAPDPGGPGLFRVDTLVYGSGRDRRRKAFGPGVALVSAGVDAHLLLEGLHGFGAWIHRRRWGFAKENLPLDGRVWLPRGSGPFPLVLIVPDAPADRTSTGEGFAYLGECLASRGNLVVAVDEAFLYGRGLEGAGAARAWLLLKHLEAWRGWNQEKGNPFFGKVDLDQVALVGHGRGAEAAALACEYNRLPCLPENAGLGFHFGFGIRAVAALAPTSSGPPPLLENVDYLALQGSHDGRMPVQSGPGAFRGVRSTDGQPHVKAAIWIHRADYGQFDASRGPLDLDPPLGHFLDAGALLGAEEQRQAARVLVSAFLEASLRDRPEYLALLRDPRTGGGWLPRTLFLSHFEASGFRVLSDFTSGLDLGRTAAPGGLQGAEGLATWRNGVLEGRGLGGSREQALFLGWDRRSGRVPRYVITLPEGLARTWALDEDSVLVLSLADAGGPGNPRDPLDFTLELACGDGTLVRMPLGRFHDMPHAQNATLTKGSLLEAALFPGPVGPVCQTFGIPLSAFVQADPAWQPSALTQVRLCFDRTPRGTVALEKVGFEP
jgi:hypothetical protein